MANETESAVLLVSISPHIFGGATTNQIMRDVVIALAPAFIASFLIFGVRAAIVVAVCVLSCVGFEWLYQKGMKQPITISDYTAVITGMLLAFNLPHTIPLWQAAFGSMIAIVLVKQLFGGLGKNFANPAITGRIVMFLAFSVTMTTWELPTNSIAAPLFPVVTGATAVDTLTGASPLALIASGKLDELPKLMDMFLGLHRGSLGETCAVALILGGIYLLVRGVITWHTPVTFIATVVLLTAVLGQSPIYQLLSGGLLLGAIFMATDYVTAPHTEAGKIVFGVGAGLLTVLFRVYGSFPEGVSFAILIMNILTPYINNFTESKPLGRVTT